MSRYVALLRGINVGATNRIAMPDLRRLVEGLGHGDVTTYLQSGNVVFTSVKRDAAKLAAGIERAIADELGLTVPVLVRDGAELSAPGNENVEFTVAGREVHLHFPDGGYGRTRFTNAYLEKRLGVVATTRNWKSVRALRDLAAG
ncbi:DUF1697 domain-containing protein [Micromonospora sp. NPDC000089]|uniref:DUF1697 domain-containing protein n=1 Tax=unclassified Micromonospora TaxID=2617518 RepID=UPI003691E264